MAAGQVWWRWVMSQAGLGASPRKTLKAAAGMQTRWLVPQQPLWAPSRSSVHTGCGRVSWQLRTLLPLYPLAGMGTGGDTAGP